MSEYWWVVFFSSRRRQTRCALVTGVQTCALPISGGAINFIAAKPTRELHYGADLSYGRFNTIEVGGFISGPITENLRGRLSFKAVNGDEWQKSYKIGRAHV